MSNFAKVSGQFFEASKQGKIFTVEFVKKDGSTRVLNGRLAKHSRQGKTGGGMTFNPANKGMVPVFDVGLYNYNMKLEPNPDKEAIAKKCYRLVTISRIKKINGVKV